jgi:predicted ATPase
VFFDRGLIDAALALERFGGEPAIVTVGSRRFRKSVFLTPPWPEIYVTDAERPHGLDAAVKEYEHLLIAYPKLGYRTIVLPKIDVASRADFVTRTLGDLSSRR